MSQGGEYLPWQFATPFKIHRAALCVTCDTREVLPGTTQARRLQVAYPYNCEAFCVWRKSQSQKGSQEAQSPRSHVANTQGNSDWNPGESGLGPSARSCTPLCAHLLLCSDYSPGNSAKQLLGFEFHLTECVTRSQATAMKKPNIKMKTNTYFSNLVHTWYSEELESLRHLDREAPWNPAVHQKGAYQLGYFCNHLLSFYCPQFSFIVRELTATVASVY